MLTGVSLNLKDKRVDKILQAKGIVTPEVFYSPVKTGPVALLMLALFTFPAIFLLPFPKYSLLILPHLPFVYLVYAYHNTSFALHDEKLTMINPNFPFKRIETVEIAEIELITIDKRIIHWHLLFLLFGRNYVMIKTKQGVKKYHCACLELDAFDENWTEKTIDDFHLRLKEKDLPVVFNLD